MALVVPGPFPFDSSRVTRNERVARFRIVLDLKAKRLPVTEIARRVGLSLDRTKEVLKQALVELFPDPKVRTAKARELGIGRSRAEYLADVREEGIRQGDRR